MADIVLAVDAGGTTVRMGLYRSTEEGLDCVLLSRHASAGWLAFESDLAGFLTLPEVHAGLQTARRRAAVFALAGPMEMASGSLAGEGATKGSVTRWGSGTFREVAPLLSPLPFDHCIVLNDMEAANHAVAGSNEEAFRTLDGNSSPPPRSRFVHLRPGTGLGMGFFLDGRSIPSEGGSAPLTFDAGDPDEISAARHFRKLSGDALPTYEAALCGNGLRALSEALAGQSVSPEDITAEWESSESSRRIVGLFLRLLSRAAQGAALTLLPETCFFSGSILEALPEGAWDPFCGWFRKHATQGHLLARVRLVLVKGPELTLRGAVLAGTRALDMEVR